MNQSTFAPTHVLWAVVCLMGVSASHGQSIIPVNPPEIRPGVLAGYLPRAQLPNSLRLLPPPPAPGSAQQAAEEASSKAALAQAGSARWQLAAQDAVLKFPAAANVFSCTLNAPISEKETPQLYTLLRRSYVDAGLSSYAAKDHYARVRPFVAFQAASCTPEDEPGLAKDGSYPSGHAAIGWAWGLLLAEMAPTKAQALLERGKAYAQSRQICAVHWQSDVDAGQLVGSATVARLHADTVFKAQLLAAQAELAEVMGRGANAGLDCAKEAAALGLNAP